MVEESRIDLKIKRDTLLRDKREDLWDQLCTAVENASTKLKDNFQKKLECRRNEGNTTIRVYGEMLGHVGADAYTPELEIRFDRGEGKIIARLAHENKVLATCRITSNREGTALSFEYGGQDRTPLFIAETLVAEKFLGIKLDE